MKIHQIRSRHLNHLTCNKLARPCFGCFKSKACKHFQVWYFTKLKDGPTSEATPGFGDAPQNRPEIKKTNMHCFPLLFITVIFLNLPHFNYCSLLCLDSSPPDAWTNNRNQWNCIEINAIHENRVNLWKFIKFMNII